MYYEPTYFHFIHDIDKQITISTPFSAEMTPSACWKLFTSSSETNDSKDSPRLADRRAVKL